MEYDFNQMNCAWITPENEIVWTCNSSSHNLLLDKIGVRKKLEEEAKHMIWSEKELELHYDTDIGYIAMKYGYVRIINYKNLFGVECIGLIEPYVKERLNEVFSLLRRKALEHNCIIDNFIIEDFCSGDYLSFQSFEELVNSIPD